MASVLKRDDFSLESAFRTLSASSDTWQEGDLYISTRSLARFFRRNGFYASQEDIDAIVRRLDLNYDGVITMDELGSYLSTNAALPLYSKIRASKVVPPPAEYQTVGREQLKGALQNSSIARGSSRTDTRLGSAPYANKNSGSLKSILASNCHPNPHFGDKTLGSYATTSIGMSNQHTAVSPKSNSTVGLRASSSSHAGKQETVLSLVSQPRIPPSAKNSKKPKAKKRGKENQVEL